MHGTDYLNILPTLDVLMNHAISLTPWHLIKSRFHCHNILSDNHALTFLTLYLPLLNGFNMVFTENMNNNESFTIPNHSFSCGWWYAKEEKQGMEEKQVKFKQQQEGR